jgi:hypothetical protein
MPMLKGHHTFDVLAEAMTEIHCASKRSEEVTRTTTDNGFNFVKVFVQFSSLPEFMPAVPSPEPN